MKDHSVAVTEIQSKNLFVFDDQVYYRSNSSFSSDEAHVLFMIALGGYFRKVTFCSRVSPIQRKASYTIPENIAILPLPFYHEVSEFLAKMMFLRSEIRQTLRRGLVAADILLLSWPHPISLLIVALHKFLPGNRLTTLLVRQNLKELVRLRYKGVRRLAGIASVSCLDYLLRFWGRDCLIFALSEETRREYSSIPAVYRVSLPIISSTNFSQAIGSRTKGGNPDWRLLYVGRVEPEKGLEALIEALAALHEKGEKVRLSIVGSGQEEDRLMGLARSFGVHDKVTFHGYIPFGEELFAQYREADIFVLPSLSEGTPNVLAEAMAFGLPIIASRVGGCDTIIRDQVNGILVDPKSVQSLLRALSDLIHDSDLRLRIARQAQSDVHMWTMERQQEAMLGLIASRLEKMGRNL